MKKRPITLGLAAASLAAACAVTLNPRPAIAMPVFDAGNYAQNLLQAARALEQINQQIQSLQNEAAMLEKMGKHLERIDFPQLGQITSAMRRVDRLMNAAEGIELQVDRLDERFRSTFPGSLGNAVRTDRRVADARARLEGAMAGFRHSMAVQAQVVENVREDAALIAKLIERSQGASGSLQAQQATNQLLALSTKQQLQLQNLMAAEFRSASFERARRAQGEAEARAATRRFLGTGRAYTPR
jgi:P-type conjugative transfer protein TrbJ